MAENKADEVNFLDLLVAFYSALGKNIFLTIGLPVAGAICGLVFAFNSPAVFQSSLLVETSLLSESEGRFLVRELEKTGSVPGMSPEDAAGLKRLSFLVSRELPRVNNTDEPLLRTNEQSIYLEVNATVYNKDVFPVLETSILSFINNSPPVQRHRAERERFYSGLISKIDEELKGMEEVKKQFPEQKQASFLNPSDLYESTVVLYKEKTRYEIMREQIRGVHLVKGFDTLSINAGQSKFVTAAIGAGIGLMVLFLLLFVQFFAQYYQRYKHSPSAT